MKIPKGGGLKREYCTHIPYSIESVVKPYKTKHTQNRLFHYSVIFIKLQWQRYTFLVHSDDKKMEFHRNYVHKTFIESVSMQKSQLFKERG